MSYPGYPPTGYPPFPGYPVSIAVKILKSLISFMQLLYRSSLCPRAGVRTRMSKAINQWEKASVVWKWAHGGCLAQVQCAVQGAHPVLLELVNFSRKARNLHFMWNGPRFYCLFSETRPHSAVPTGLEFIMLTHREQLLFFLLWSSGIKSMYYHT